jgi:MAE_28990/MAE_18760-like HEPN
MINYEEFRAEIEIEREWREAEVRLLKNQISRNENIEEQKKLRKALIVILYAYFEGICKFSLLSYVKYINELNLNIEEVSLDIKTCAISDILNALINIKTKNPYFKNIFPHDEKLHRHHRNREFVKESHRIFRSIVHIDDKIIVDTESNLKPSILKKILLTLRRVLQKPI